jgi:GNAT superfamily N-acetyltransferase/predicted GNAT family acetyltransferase
MYSIIKLDSATVKEYEMMTYPLWYSRLQNLENTGSIIALGVSKASQPIGLALAEIIPNTGIAQILSLFVKPKYRQSGIGSALLNSLEQELRRFGCTKMQLTYISGAATMPALEHLLSKQNWSSDRSQMIVCNTTTNILKNAPWLDSYFLPSSFSIFPLVELTLAEYQTIQEQQAIAPWYPEILSPFRGELPVEPLNSLGLRYRGEVVGWIATHRISPDTIRYTSLFVRKDLQKMGRAISLVAEAIKIQVNSDIPQCICAVFTDNEPMVRFVERRLVPFLTKVRETKRSHKLLIP